MRELLPSYELLVAKLEQDAVSDSVRRLAYEQFFREQGYTQVDWDSSLSWYAKHDILLFHDLYRSTSDSLNRWITKLQERQELKQSISLYEQERLQGSILDANMLNLPRRYYRLGELINIPFSVNLSVPYDSTKLLQLCAVAYGDSLSSVSLEFNLLLEDSTSVREKVMLNVFGRACLEYPIKPSQSVRSLEGVIRGVAKGNVLLDSLRLTYREAEASVPDSLPVVEQ